MLLRIQSWICWLSLLSLLVFGFATNVAAQDATFVGAVLAHSTQQPIANAEVTIASLRRTVRSDEAGIFSFGVIPAGVYRVSVRAVGREPFDETVAFGTSGEVQRGFLLAPAKNVLEQVNVRADASPDAVRMADFNQRRALGFGRFLGQETLEKESGRLLTDVLNSRMPGLRVIGSGSEARLANARGYTRLSRATQCFVRVFVDGLQLDEFPINGLDPASVAGIEYFTVSQTPAQFNSTGVACGMLMIWTRLRLP